MALKSYAQAEAKPRRAKRIRNTIFFMFFRFFALQQLEMCVNGIKKVELFVWLIALNVGLGLP